MKQGIQGILPAFSRFALPSGTVASGPPLVFLHGFLGSKKNFNKMAQHFKKKLGRECYTLDARNHGTSPHIPSFSYESQTNDLVQFMNHTHLDKATFIGYSMGAKTAMSYALQHPDRVDKLVCIDNAPDCKPIGPEFEAYIRALVEVTHWCQQHIHKHSNKEFRKHILQKMVKEVDGDQKMALYLLDNIDLRQGRISSRIPLEMIDEKALHELGEFPEFESVTSRTEALFIKAQNSPFIDERGTQASKRMFPNSDIKIINGATHAGILVDHYGIVMRLIEEHMRM